MLDSRGVSHQDQCNGGAIPGSCRQVVASQELAGETLGFSPVPGETIPISTAIVRDGDDGSYDYDLHAIDAADPSRRNIIDPELQIDRKGGRVPGWMWIAVIGAAVALVAWWLRR